MSQSKHDLPIVDNEPDVCESAPDLLRRQFRVRTTHSFPEGFRLMQEKAKSKAGQQFCTRNYPRTRMIKVYGDEVWPAGRILAAAERGAASQKSRSRREQPAGGDTRANNWA
jgi:hypothetical protein